MRIRIAIESLMCVCILVMLVMVTLMYSVNMQPKIEFISKPNPGYTKIGYGVGINTQGDTIAVQELSESNSMLK